MTVGGGTSIVPVILSGGMGTRLWPASRRSRPKQFLDLVDDRSMIRATVDRITTLPRASEPIVVTNADHADAIMQEMRLSGHPDAVLILEPVGRNTAPAVALAAYEIIADRGDSLMMVLPSDHTMRDDKAFGEAVGHAAEAATAGFLATFGIAPSRPETGYGYIKMGDPIDEDVSLVAEFREKPDEETAARYVESGTYLWNSGMYLFMASRYLEELELHAPEISAAARAASEAAERDGSQVTIDFDAFSRCPSDSIDYAVMELTSRAAVVPMDPGWSDVGSWTSLWDLGDKDMSGNVVTGDVRVVSTTNSYIRGVDRLIAAVGLENIIIVDTPDALLVTTMDHAQDVKEVVDRLQADDRPEYD